MNINCDCGYEWNDIHERVRFCHTGKICRNPNDRPTPAAEEDRLNVEEQPREVKPKKPKVKKDE